ncbi:putative nuclease HARBI1 [Prorops nasuta]|uniref:putative nuclease HARBI1 n=1 Tax=Prorops nasuta TaxID=863751 RepID=UPI0034CEE176
MPKFIKWPTREEIIIISESFKRHKGFPNIVGAIDGTHIKIAAPKSDPESYINRKGFHSMQLQVVCDNKMQFLYCYVGNAGSLHDQRVFRLSKLQNICNDENNFPCNGHLIGDAAYMIQKHLLVPFKDNGHLTRIQKNFNYCLSSTRMVIERSIGLLKGRFRTLLDRLPMTRTDLILKHIMACCVLHNVCLLKNDLIVESIIIDTQERHQENNDIPTILRMQGIQKRNEVANSLQMVLYPHAFFFPR